MRIMGLRRAKRPPRRDRPRINREDSSKLPRFGCFANTIPTVMRSSARTRFPERERARLMQADFNTDGVLDFAELSTLPPPPPQSPDGRDRRFGEDGAGTGFWTRSGIQSFWRRSPGAAGWPTESCSRKLAVSFQSQ